MRTSVHQWYLTLLTGLAAWISPLLRPACLSEAACSEFAGAAISR